MYKDYEDLVNFTHWVMELFPSVWVSAFKLVYDRKEDKIVWGYVNRERDRDDHIQLLVANAKQEFFESVVAPRIAALKKSNPGVRISSKSAGAERVLITFTPRVRREFRADDAIFGAFLDRDFAYGCGGWVVRHPNAASLPPQG